jgi:microcystin-dependent protein
MAVHVYNEADLKADLYARIPGDGEYELLSGDTSLGDIPPSLWQYDASSSATDDFANGVIKPTAQMGNGRWLRRYKAAVVATTGAYSDLSGLPTIPAAIPSGAMLMWGTSSAPSGWLLCDNTAVSRTTYADLFAVIGTTFGVGDGSTTFNLPDYRQRFPLGKAASGTGSTLAGTGGTIDHLHTADPASATSTSAGSHNHGGATGTPSATVAATNLTGSAASTTHTHSISTDGAHTHDVDIASFNTGTANPPFLSINFIIKS